MTKTLVTLKYLHEAFEDGDRLRVLDGCMALWPFFGPKIHKSATIRRSKQPIFMH